MRRKSLQCGRSWARLSRGSAMNSRQIDSSRVNQAGAVSTALAWPVSVAAGSRCTCAAMPWPGLRCRVCGGFNWTSPQEPIFALSEPVVKEAFGVSKSTLPCADQWSQEVLRTLNKDKESREVSSHALPCPDQRSREVLDCVRSDALDNESLEVGIETLDNESLDVEMCSRPTLPCSIPGRRGAN